MIVVMKNGASSEEIAETVERIKALGLKAHIIEGTERTVVAAIGEKREEMKEERYRGETEERHERSERDKD